MLVFLCHNVGRNLQHTLRNVLEERRLYVLYVSQDDDACTGDEPKDEFVCKSDQCRQAASRILASMNLRTDPCRDFYKFACGGWSPGTGVWRRNMSSRYGQSPELSFSTLQHHVDQQIQSKFCIGNKVGGAATFLTRGDPHVTPTQSTWNLWLTKCL